MRRGIRGAVWGTDARRLQSEGPTRGIASPIRRVSGAGQRSERRREPSPESRTQSQDPLEGQQKKFRYTSHSSRPTAPGQPTRAARQSVTWAPTRLNIQPTAVGGCKTAPVFWLPAFGDWPPAVGPQPPAQNAVIWASHTRIPLRTRLARYAEPKIEGTSVAPSSTQRHGAFGRPGGGYRPRPAGIPSSVLVFRPIQLAGGECRGTATRRSR